MPRAPSARPPDANRRRGSGNLIRPVVRLGGLALLSVCAALSAPTGSYAQQAPPTQLEARADAFAGDASAVHAGAGLTAPLGTYVRFGVVGGVGGGADGLSGRADLVARFTLDPFREKRWAPYAVGGISARFDDRSRQFLLLLAGIEGPVRRGFAPAVEFGFGGSPRVGFALRQGVPRRR